MRVALQPCSKLVRRDSSRLAHLRKFLAGTEAFGLEVTDGVCTLASGNHDQPPQQPITPPLPRNICPQKILCTLDFLYGGIDPSVYATLLGLYGHRCAAPEGRLVHDHIIRHALEDHGSLGTHLVQMYCRCSALEDACTIFSRMRHRQVACVWNVQIKSFSEHGLGQEALQLFEQMQQEGVVADEFTYVGVICACTAAMSLNKGIQTQVRATDSSLVESNPILGTALIHMFHKCDSMGAACRLFEHVREGNVMAWTAIISMHVQLCNYQEAVLLFNRMQQEGELPNNVIFASVLSAYAILSDISTGKRLHAQLYGSETESDVLVGTTLISLYGKCNRFKDARTVLYAMPEQNAVAWNAMIAACAQCGEEERAIQHYHQMIQHAILPDKATFTSVIDACTKCTGLADGIRIHVGILGDEFGGDVPIASTLITMYSKHGKLSVARWIFDEMTERNTITWNVMITACIQHGHSKDAIAIFHHMLQEGMMPSMVTFSAFLNACANIPVLSYGKNIHACISGIETELDAHVITALINMYSSCGNMEYAHAVFDQTLKSDVTTWNALISGYVQNDGKKALFLFKQMQLEGLIPSEPTFASLLNLFASPVKIEEGKQLHLYIEECGLESSVTINNALICMYGKCGNLRSAQMVFDKMRTHSVISWTALLGAYVEYGHAQKALLLFEDMLKEVKPDGIAFLVVLTACNYADLVEKGKHLFECMSRDYGILPNVDHYNCMIGLLQKTGRADEAEILSKGMPNS